MFRALNLASVEIVLSQNGTSTGVHQPSNVLAKSSKKEADALLKLWYASSAREKKQTSKTNTVCPLQCASSLVNRCCRYINLMTYE